MDALEALNTRRSVRNFSDKVVSYEEIKILLSAGMQAPSANNEQPWRFIVVDKRELLNRIPDFHPWSRMMTVAMLAIIVCAFVPEGKKFDMWVQDCAAASENILLAAHAIGMGGVWLGVHPREERISGTRRLFGLPNEIHPFSILALGYPAELPSQVDRFDPRKIHYNSWEVNYFTCD